MCITDPHVLYIHVYVCVCNIGLQCVIEGASFGDLRPPAGPG